MNIERTSEGVHVELRPAGAARFAGAAFLSVWLVGWAFGEAFALWILGTGAWSLLTGTPMSMGQGSLELGPALAAGLFLVCWLTLWSVGGYAAGRELLRLLFGADDLRADRDGLEIVRRYGPFSSKTFLPRAGLLGVHCLPGNGALVAVTPTTSVELTRLGQPEERAAIAEALAKKLELDAAPVVACIPSGWRELKSPDGKSILIRNPDTRRKQARVVAGLAAAVVTTAVVLLVETARNSNLGALAGIVTAFALALSYAAARLGFTRNEWIVEPGRLTLQRRTGRSAATKFSARALELRQSSDSDGDHLYQLVATLDQTTDPMKRHTRIHQRTIDSQTNDAAALRNLGAWLSQRAHIPFSDRTTPEAKTRDFENLRAQLAGSGRLGRAMSGLLKHAAPKTAAAPERNK